MKEKRCSRCKQVKLELRENIILGHTGRIKTPLQIKTSIQNITNWNKRAKRNKLGQFIKEVKQR